MLIWGWIVENLIEKNYIRLSDLIKMKTIFKLIWIKKMESKFKEERDPENN